MFSHILRGFSYQKQHTKASKFAFLKLDLGNSNPFAT